MDSLTVEEGRNTKTGQIHSPEKADPNEVYTCTSCQQELIVIERRTEDDGTIVRQHYRHHPDALTRICRYRSDEDLEDVRRSAIDAYRADEDRRRLRVFIERRTYAQDYEFQAQIPALTDDDVRTIRMASGKSAGETIKIEAPSALVKPRPALLLPKAGPGYLRIPIDPKTNDHAITLQGSPEFSIKGTWRATRIREATFIGQEESAELVTFPKYITEGITIFFRPRGGGNLPDGATTVKVGADEFARVIASKENFEWLKQQITSLIALDAAPLRVDIILPFLHDPRAERYLRAPAGEKCLIAIVPGTTIDPELDVLEIGLATSQRQVIPQSGIGKPRFVEFDMPESRHKLLVLWPRVKDREVRLDVAPAEIAPLADLQVPDFGVENVKSVQRGLAEFDDTLNLEEWIETNPDSPDYDIDHPVHVPEVKLLGFTQLRVRLRSEYASPDGPRWRDDGPANSEDFSGKVQGALRLGARRIEVDFGTMGRVTLRCDHFYDEKVRAFSRQELELVEQEKRREAMRTAPKPVRAPRVTATAPAKNALEALSERSAKQREEQETLRAGRETERDENLYEQLLKDPALQRRILQERAAPRDVNRSFAARVVQVKNTPQNADYLDQWRNPIRRFIRANPRPARRLQRKEPRHVKQPTNSVPQQPPGKRAHHDSRTRKQKASDPMSGTTLSKRAHREAEREIAKAAEARKPRTAIPEPEAPVDLPPTPPAPSRRDQLRQLKERAKAGEAVELPRSPKVHKFGLRPKAAAPPPPPAKKAPAPKLLRLTDFDRRLARHPDDLPEEVDAAFIARLYDVPEAEATAPTSANLARLQALLKREKHRRKQNEDAAKARRDTR